MRKQRVRRSPQAAAARRQICKAAARAYRVESLEGRLLLSNVGLVAAYGFEENAGTVSSDVSGHSNTATLEGATWSTSGKFGNALSFNGTSNDVVVADNNTLDLTTGMTLEAWIFPTSSTGVRDIMLKESSTVDIYNMYDRNAFGLPESNVFVGGTNKTAQGSAIAANAWTHVAGTYDGTTLSLYVNGALVNSTAAPGTLTNSTGALRIGGNSLWGEWFQGRIDEVRVYNRALPASEIVTDMNTPVTQTVPDTTPPAVSAVTPINGSINVAVGVNLTATFNELMTASTVTGTTVDLRDPNGALVPATVTYNSNTSVVTLDPTSNLTTSPGYYTVTIHGGTSGVKDLAGNAMVNDLKWSFSTGTPVFQDRAIFTGLTQPTNIQFAPDGRIFVTEKRGVVKEFDNINDTTPTIVADLNAEVHNFWDRGMTGLALDPQFPTRPYIYLEYCYDGDIGGPFPKYGTAGVYDDPAPNATTTGAPASGRISRITINTTTNVMVPGSELVLLNDYFIQFYTHSVGTIVFGPDGMLYAGGGDGAEAAYADYGQTGGNPGGDPNNQGGALRSQDLQTTNDPTTLDGAIIRIDPNTAAPVSTNPLFGTGSDTNAKRIISEGLRNPYRFTFRPGTNEIWIADTGWNTWEEIDRINNAVGGPFQNFGWPAYEGFDPQPSYQSLNLPLLNNLYNNPSAVTSPYFTYNHSAKVDPTNATEPTGSSAIAGIAFYPAAASAFPQAFAGALFFNDYSRSRIWVMYAGPNGDPNPANIQTFSGTGTGGAAGHPVGVWVGPDGNLYYPDLDDGEIHQMTFSSSNHPPTAILQANQTTGPAPLTVQFNGSTSFDPDQGDTLTYSWDLNGDGTFGDSTVAVPSPFTYTNPGTYNVQLRVTDNHGLSGTSSVQIKVGNPPVPFIDTPSTSFHWKVGDLIGFSGHATDTEDVNIPASGLTWTFQLYQAAEETPTQFILRGTQTFVGVSSGQYSAPDWEYPVYVLATLTATDSSGLQTSINERLDPQLVTLNFQSAPAGLNFIINGRTKTTPFSVTKVVNSTNTIGALTPQSVGSTSYVFSDWSDGGAATHTIAAPAATATYTATYTVSALPGPVAAYNFDETTGTTVADATGHGNTGTITGATHVTTGKYAGALSFNGTSNLVTIPDSAWLDLTTAMTLEAWVNPSVATGTRDVIMKEGPSVDYYNMYARDDFAAPEGNIFVGGTNRVAKGATLPINAWTYLATTYDGSTLSLWVNGTAVASTAVTGSIAVSSGNLRIGGNSIWGEWFQGMIDDVRIYARALSGAEIATDMNTAVFLDHPPTANISATPLSGLAPLTVNFDGTGSSDPDPGDSLTYAWDLDNDGLYNDSTLPTPQYIFTTGGSKTVRLLVTDSHGQTAAASKIINVNTAPTMFIDAPVIGVTWKVGDTINFLGHATDNEDGALAASAITWQLILHHGATTQVLQTFTAVDHGQFTTPDQPYPCYLELAATATDSLGAQTTSSVVLDPQTVNLNFVTVPAGLSLTVDGIGGITPFSRTVIVGSGNGVDASTDQVVGITTYSLASWSDGGDAAHAIVAPQDDTTYFARFASVTVIDGTSGDDNIQLTLIAPDQLQFQINSDPAFVVHLGLGNSVIIDGGLGTDSLVVTDAVGNDVVSIDAASISMGSAFSASYTSIERTAFGGTGAPDALAVTGREVALAGNLTLSNLTAGTGGELDVLDKSLTLDYVGTSPLSQVLALIQAGRSSGALSGGTASILTSMGDSVHFTLGVADNTSTHQITVKYTRYGDANLDGIVDTTDLLVLATNWLQSGRTFQTGDFNYDGTVDNVDLGLLAANWQLSVTSPGSALSSSMPASLIPKPPSPPSRRVPVRVTTSASELVTSALQ